MNEPQPNALFINDGNGSFLYISRESGTYDVGVGRGVVCGYFNNGGRLHTFAVNVGDVNGSSGIARLF